MKRMEIIRDINKLTKLKCESFYRLERGTFFIYWQDLEKGIDKAPIYIKTRDEERGNALNLMDRRAYVICENEACYVLDNVKIEISAL